MVTGFIRRYPKLAVAVVGIWFVFVMLFLGEATNGAAYGLPMHLVGATFFVIVLVVKRIADRSPASKSSSKSESQTPPVPDIDTIQDAGDPEITRPETLQDGYSTEPENMEFGYTQPTEPTTAQETGREEERDNGLEALRDTEIVDED